MTDQNKEPQERTDDYSTRLNRERADIEQGDITETVIEMTEKVRESVGATGGYTAALMRGRHRLSEVLKELDYAHAEYIKSDEWARLCELYPDLEPIDAYFIAYLTKDLIEYEPE